MEPGRRRRSRASTRRTGAITLTGNEATQLEYKYALGAWDYVEKDAACGEIANRQLTLSYGATGRRS